MHRDSFSILRDTMRWRVALVLAVLLMALMVALGSLNTALGYRDTAILAWFVLSAVSACLVTLLVLPRRLGGTIFFSVIAIVLVLTIAFGQHHGRPMQHWAFIFPPVLVFLLSARHALFGMIAFGAYVSIATSSVAATIDIVRFASGYGMLVCFIYTYALLQERAAAMLRYHSDHDALTNCLNRRTFNEALDQLSASASRHACTFLLIDIDHFKAVNDGHGHLTGDRIITQVAAELGRHLGPGVGLFRYGGEEFAIMLGADVDAGVQLAERLRTHIADSDFQGIEVSVSIGVAGWQRGHGSVAMAVGRADRALYEAKRSGRNRVVVDHRATAVDAIA
jgi:diguanylate cyclase (GGDEF)-like protein